jgi:hypothetical protein
MYAYIHKQMRALYFLAYINRVMMLCIKPQLSLLCMSMAISCYDEIGANSFNVLLVTYLCDDA